ncbi:MAG: endolytic transglycosylase MltG [candidate division Zixibacteria bacterium]
MEKTDTKISIFKYIGKLAAVVALGALILSAVTYYFPKNIGDKTVTVIVRQGNSFKSVTGQLVEGGVLSSKVMLKISARIFGVDKRLIPGRYDFTGKNSYFSVLKKLGQGDFVRIKVTIPEGATIWETTALLADSLKFESDSLKALNKETKFLAEQELPYLEGYLFPETYYFPWGSSAREAAAIMVKQYRSMTDSLWPEQIVASLTKEEIIILASIIEAETGDGNERELVSSVYHNRLKKKMKLDADPTVIYGLGGLKRSLWLKDLKKKTPYNTYLKRGLPPTPINSPGLAAIKAALYPAESDYYYFVADNGGKHLFSKTNAEHNRNRQQIKREQKEARGK